MKINAPIRSAAGERKVTKSTEKFFSQFQGYIHEIFWKFQEYWAACNMEYLAWMRDPWGCLETSEIL